MFRVILLPLLISATTLVAGCPKQKFEGDDAVMMQKAKVLANAINEYHRATAEWPSSLRSVQSYLPPGESWPANPYDGKPIEDTGSPEFDPATSVGMVYFQPMKRNDMIVNVQLHVFGEADKLYIISNTAMGLKE